MYKEVIGDLFQDKDEKDIIYIQCISADLAMGAGIAIEFNKYFNIKNNILEMKKEFINTKTTWDIEIGQYIYATPVINLVTKKRYWHKPKLEDLMLALDNAKECIEHLQTTNTIKIKEIRLPKIGCGLDRLKWEDVKPKIIELSQYFDIDIAVYCK